MDWGAWQAAACGVAKSQRWLRTHTLLLNNSGEQIHSLCHASGVSKHVCTCSSRPESRLPAAILLVPPALQPAKGTWLSPGDRLQGCSWQCPIYDSNHSLPLDYFYPCNPPPPPCPLTVTQVLTWSHVSSLITHFRASMKFFWQPQ